jgi:hypothetical protein
MKMFMRGLYSSAVILMLVLTPYTPAHAQKRSGVNDRFANVNGVRLHYLTAGRGEPVILLHGYA